MFFALTCLKGNFFSFPQPNTLTISKEGNNRGCLSMLFNFPIYDKCTSLNLGKKESILVTVDSSTAITSTIFKQVTRPKISNCTSSLIHVISSNAPQLWISKNLRFSKVTTLMGFVTNVLESLKENVATESDTNVAPQAWCVYILGRSVCLD